MRSCSANDDRCRSERDRRRDIFANTSRKRRSPSSGPRNTFPQCSGFQWRSRRVYGHSDRAGYPARMRRASSSFTEPSPASEVVSVLSDRPLEVLHRGSAANAEHPTVTSAGHGWRAGGIR